MKQEVGLGVLAGPNRTGERLFFGGMKQKIACVLACED